MLLIRFLKPGYLRRYSLSIFDNLQPADPQLTSDLKSQLQEILGPSYRIDRELGGGGMSRVFVATDVELERQVVIKVLPPELSAGINTDRFRREIQLAARLQHPHIVPLLAAGSKGSLLYYTMPFIGGENLRTQLSRTGELPVQEATRILREVADALSYAHRQGVVHRDIKPENILISGNHALVTDFGVSKALTSATAETPVGGSSLTSLGMALGTPAYMAPEQAVADPKVDQRADIYALGVVGYELLAGQTPFPGLNPQQTLAAQVTTAPAPVLQHRPQLPPGLAAVIMRCLEKRASDRWQSAQDLHAALEPYAVTSGASAPFEPAVSRKGFSWTPHRIAVAAGLTGLVATAVIASTIAFRRDGGVITVGNTRQVTSAPGLEVHPRISPDGRMIAYIAGSLGESRLFVRQLAGGRSIALTDSGMIPVWPQWSADGSEIFFKSRQLAYVIPALGGAPTPVPAMDSLIHCSWSNSGDRVACGHRAHNGLVIAGPRGENPRVSAEPGSGGPVNATAWSADDKFVAFVRGNSSFLGGSDFSTVGNISPAAIWVVRAAGGGSEQVAGGTHLNTSPVWTPDGNILYVSSSGGGRDIYMQRLSNNLKLHGPPERLTTGLNAHSISLSRDGRTLAYSVFNTVANVWSASLPANPDGAPVLKPVTSGTQTVEQFVVSPDGKWLAYDSNLNGNQDIFKVPLAGGDAQQLTRNRVDNFYPSWSPNGTEIAFHTLQNGNRDIFIMDANGGNVRPVVVSPEEERAPIWLPDGTGCVERDSNFLVRREKGNWMPRTFFGLSAMLPVMSPDGKWFAVGGRQGFVCPACQEGVYLRATDGSELRRLPTRGLDSAIVSGGRINWSRDSRRVFASVREQDGIWSIWEFDIDGHGNRRLFRFTDPNRQLYLSRFDVHDDTFFFTIGDRQSDIWVMELKKQ